MSSGSRGLAAPPCSPLCCWASHRLRPAPPNRLRPGPAARGRRRGVPGSCGAGGVCRGAERRPDQRRALRRPQRGAVFLRRVRGASDRPGGAGERCACRRRRLPDQPGWYGYGHGGGEPDGGPPCHDHGRVQSPPRRRALLRRWRHRNKTAISGRFFLCSTGFAVRLSVGGVRMVTAGHCFPNSMVVLTEPTAHTEGCRSGTSPRSRTTEGHGADRQQVLCRAGLHRRRHEYDQQAGGRVRQRGRRVHQLLPQRADHR